MNCWGDFEIEDDVDVYHEVLDAKKTEAGPSAVTNKDEATNVKFHVVRIKKIGPKLCCLIVVCHYY